MPKFLVIAEKPSVATDLARVLGKMPELGKFEKKADYFENKHGYISSAIGHLVELKMPLTKDGKKLPWGMKHLPVIPTSFELQPIERSESRFKLLIRLLKIKDVDTVVNACDAGREGELIFRYLLEMADLDKELLIKRMWMQSMTDQSIKDAWGHMRTEKEMRPLADAAMCRSESDWLIGLNGTRALTAYNSRNGGFNVTTAGRVQTPTLVILTEREKEIRAFIPRTYYEVYGDFEVTRGSYPGKWFREEFEKDDDDDHSKAERIWSLAEAEAVRDRCLGKTGTVSETRKPTKQAPPQLFDLTSLQREAGNKFGYSASRTLQLAQALYDRHKLLTYPRTDSKYLPDDYLETVRSTFAGFTHAKTGPSFPPEYVKFSQWIVDNDRVTPTKRIFDTSKVSDHFAIIPTENLPGTKLDEDARKLYDLVVKRFMAIFFPHSESEITRRVTRIGEDTFRTDGRILVVPGYLEVYGRKPGAAGDKDELVAVKEGESANAISVDLRVEQTRPPARFNDSTLLSAMETAGKRVDDEELRDAMSERGLGTPATRASIIENLIRQKYVFRDDRNKRDLVVSNKGIALVDLLEEIGITTISSPELTGEWEHKLKEMEHGRLDRKQFMREIRELAIGLVDQTKRHVEELVSRPFPNLLAPCPECSGQVHRQTDGLFECRNDECSFRLKKHIASYELTEDDARELMTKLRVGPIDKFKNRFGQPFAATLTIAKEKKSWKVNFEFEGQDTREDELDNLSEDQVICEVPLDDDSGTTARVYQTDRAYLAPDMAKKTDERGVRISKSILQKEIPSEQAVKLFVQGKTDLMPGFLSKKGRRFAAHLTLDRKTGKLGFEFAPRKEKKAVDGTKADSIVSPVNAEGTRAPETKPEKKKTVKKKAAKKPTRKSRKSDS